MNEWFIYLHNVWWRWTWIKLELWMCLGFNMKPGWMCGGAGESLGWLATMLSEDAAMQREKTYHHHFLVSNSLHETSCCLGQLRVMGVGSARTNTFGLNGLPFVVAVSGGMNFYQHFFCLDMYPIHICDIYFWTQMKSWRCTHNWDVTMYTGIPNLLIGMHPQMQSCLEVILT